MNEHLMVFKITQINEELSTVVTKA